MLGGVREILGSRTLLGFQVLPNLYEPWLVMILPAGAFLTLGLLMAYFNNREINKKTKQREAILQKHLSSKQSPAVEGGEA